MAAPATEQSEAGEWARKAERYRVALFGAEEVSFNHPDRLKFKSSEKELSNKLETGKRNKKEYDGSNRWEPFTNGQGVKIWYHQNLNKVTRVDPFLGRKQSMVAPDAQLSQTSEEKEGEEEKERVQYSAADILDTMEMIESQVEAILEQSHALSSLVCDDLREISKRMSNVRQQIQQGGSLDDRDDVEALVEFEKLPWEFDNAHVHQYRRQALEHILSLGDDDQYHTWHVPQFKSNIPLPLTQDKVFSVQIHLPRPPSDPNDQEKQSEEPPVCRLGISERDTVDKILAVAYEKCPQPPEQLGPLSDWVLKAEGSCDYMMGEELLFEYDSVRKKLRNGKPVRLVMVRRPEPVVYDPEVDLRQQYMERVVMELKPVVPTLHRGLNVAQNWQELTELPLRELHIPFRFRLVGLDHISDHSMPRLGSQPLTDSTDKLFVRSYLIHGFNIVDDSKVETPAFEIREHLNYSKECRLPLNLSELPRECRMVFEARSVSPGGEEQLVAWAVLPLVDESGALLSGRQAIRLWSVEARNKGKHKKRDLGPDFIFRATTRDNRSDRQAAVLLAEFDRWELPVVAPLTEKYRAPDIAIVGAEVPLASLKPKEEARLRFWCTEDAADVLEGIPADDKELLWRMRHSMVKYPKALPKFLQCVKWAIPEHKFEAYRLLKSWEKFERPEHALELLDARYPDYTVRKHAVDVLMELDDEQLRMYMLQLTQCLKFEPYHHSPLSEFLISRALKNPHTVGHYFFWNLKAELHAPHFTERFAMLLEHYLSNAGLYAHELRKQASAMLKLQKVAEMIVKMKRRGATDEEAMAEYRRELRRLNSDFFEPMGKFRLPFNSKVEATKLLIPKCRYMSSKMVPLWLVFQSADPEDKEPLYFIFKSGDDLRQDMMTLQLLKVMDRMWLQNDKDLKMTPYEVIATGVNDDGEGVGMIQVVMNSDTTSGIQLKYGGGAVGALRLDPIDQFIRQYNEGQHKYEKAVDNFIASCAGYCVATFVLGIGDRHNGNIMVTKDGHLFHIDFGHFLGNFKKKFGVNRERAAFVFTPEMAYVIGGRKYRKSDKFKQFGELCSEAYKALRENASFLETLFILMTAAGMPELMEEKDIYYMREKLALNMPWKKADQRLHAEIRKSLDTTYRRIDNMIHNLRHG
eukprot:g11522.t1